MRRAASMHCSVFLSALLLAGPAAAQTGCTIQGSTMTCPNGVIINGVGTNVFFGNKALSEGTGEARGVTGGEVHDFGNKGIIIGGQGEAERIDRPAVQPR